MNELADPLVPMYRQMAVIAVVLGGLVGSFLNVVAYRLPAGQSVVHPPSACPDCGSRIRPRHNIPVIGWLMLRGKCRDCGVAISPRYPAVEAVCAVMWGALFWAMVPTPQTLLEPLRVVGFLLYASYFSALLGASLIDADHFILPPSIVYPLIPLGWVVVAFLDGSAASEVTFPEAVLGSLAGAGVMLAILIAGRIGFGKEAMGGGDVTLVAAIGAWQGLHPTLLLTIFGASLFGSILGITAIALHGRDREHQLPFGPYLCGAALLSWLAGDSIVALVLPSFS